MNLTKTTVTLMAILSCTLLQSCTTAKRSQDLQLGKMTFESGDYPLAFHRLLPLAVDGNPEAQYAIGYMYYYGYATQQDEQIGLFWMNKSAAQGYAPAVEALQMIHQRGRKPIRKPRPVFQNGLPRVSENITQFPKANVLTKADLPVVQKPEKINTDTSVNDSSVKHLARIEQQPIVMIGFQPSQNNCDMGSACDAMLKTLKQYFVSLFAFNHTDIKSETVEVAKAKKAEPEAPVQETTVAKESAQPAEQSSPQYHWDLYQTNGQYHYVLACQKSTALEGLPFDQNTVLTHWQHYTPWVKSVLV